VTFDRPHARFRVSVADDEVDCGRRRAHAAKCRGQRRRKASATARWRTGWR
jgi:hypothetical protein